MKSESVFLSFDSSVLRKSIELGWLRQINLSETYGLMSSSMSITGERDGKWAVSQYRKYPKHAKLCDYIVISEFDIDTGSTVRHQYPEKIEGVTEDWLAENMLPEGVHNRDADSTFIFLNRDKLRLDEDYLINPSLLGTNGKDESPSPGSTFPKVFRYGFNLVSTKHDSSVRRGATVKAMAIFSSYPFVDCLEGPLYTSLELYFKHPDRSVLADLYATLNSYDMRNIPCPSVLEKNLMRRGISVNPQGISAYHHIPSSWNHHIELNSHLPVINSTKNKTENKTEGADAADVADVAGNNTNIDDTTKNQSDDSTELTMDNRNISLPVTSISIPLHRDLDCMGHISVTSLAKLFGESTMRIYNAILSRQRVIFVGYNHAARDVCRMVLSAAAMISPVPTVLRRTYPYANLTDLSFLEV